MQHASRTRAARQIGETRRDAVAQLGRQIALPVVDNARQLHQREGIPFEQFTLDELEWVAEHTGVPLKFRSNGSR